jgi:hypothetical protein
MPDRDLTQDSSRHELDPELLRSLEQQKGVEVGQSRKHARIEVELKVVVRPANASEHARFRLQGITADLSRGGCRLILPLPVGVGDVFRIEFAGAEPAIAPAFARCLRCRLVREQVFEAGFCFLAPIDLPQRDASGQGGQPG